MPHIADTSYSAGSTSNPAITAGVSILGNSPLLTLQYTTHNWGSGTKPFVFEFVGTVNGSTSQETETVLAMVLRQTSSATAYTSNSVGSYLASSRESATGSSSFGVQRLVFEVNLSANTSYYCWLFVGGEQGITTLADATIEVRGLNI